MCNTTNKADHTTIDPTLVTEDLWTEAQPMRIKTKEVCLLEQLGGDDRTCQKSSQMISQLWPESLSVAFLPRQRSACIYTQDTDITHCSVCMYTQDTDITHCPVCMYTQDTDIVTGKLGTI